MKLASFSFKATPRLPGMRPGDLVTVETGRPPGSLKDWRLALRGQQVFLISQPGWTKDSSVKHRDPNGPVTIFEIPRAEVTFEWSGTPSEIEAILKGGKYDSDPFGPPPEAAPAPSLLAQVPVSQMGDA